MTTTEDVRTVPRADHERLARLVIVCLDHQKKYFASKGDRTLLAECRDHERRLRAAAEAALTPPPSATLFGFDTGGES